jgi:hypothetical protein
MMEGCQREHFGSVTVSKACAVRDSVQGDTWAERRFGRRSESSNFRATFEAQE